MTQMKNKHKLPFQAEDMGALLHTALRKECSSKITSAAYNLVVVIPKDDWMAYLVPLHEAMASKKIKSVGELVALARMVNRDKFEYIANQFRACLYCIFELFTDDDWAGMLSYVSEEMGIDE